MDFKLKIIISWVLVIMWMILIFLLSDITGTESHDKSVGGIEKTITVTANVTNYLGITKESNEQKIRISNLAEALNYPVRKCMHILEYLILTLLLYNAFYQSGIKDKRTFLFSMLICFLYACSDEFHQLFRERTGQFKDVIIDTFGGVIALFLIKIGNKR